MLPCCTLDVPFETAVTVVVLVVWPFVVWLVVFVWLPLLSVVVVVVVELPVVS
jgi:hypothetical protein